MSRDYSNPNCCTPITRPFSGFTTIPLGLPHLRDNGYWQDGGQWWEIE